MYQRIVYSLAAIILSGIFLISCFKDLPSKHIVYDNNFEDTPRNNIKIYNAGGIIDSPKIFLFNGSKVLGRFNNNLVTLKIDALPEHNAVHVQFDLFIHDKWEGDHLDPVTKIPDVWQMQIDKGVVYQTTFSNTANTQSFPDNFKPNVSPYPAHSNAWGLLPGACALSDKKDGTAYYKIDYITGHTAASLLLELNDALQPFGQPCQKSWSIDNLVITATKY